MAFLYFYFCIWWITTICSRDSKFLSPNTLRDLARDVGFVQRTSKYQAKDLVALCIWMSQNIAITSLAQLSSCLEASTEVPISPEGMNQRFNKSAVQFLQHILTNLLNKKLTSSIPLSSPYTSVFKRIFVSMPIYLLYKILYIIDIAGILGIFAILFCIKSCIKK